MKIRETTTVLGMVNVVLFVVALLFVAIPEGRAAEQDADQGCWREREVSVMLPPEKYCCSWLECNCSIFEYGECVA